ncbi:MAG TPA: toll/interleukin-1 receptor domain-containing protein, partial [Gaiellaceae bacterium]|nr:toll/interleukin-1 receptor domain-containing protein [Gaiellaceae bacterium]
MEVMTGHHQVFISYASPDEPTASAICNALEAAGVRCWIAPRDIGPGESYAAAIVRAIETVRMMIVVLSESASESQQVEREVERAGNERIIFLPVRIDGSPMSKPLEFFLSTPHWFNATTPPLADQLPRLVSVVRDRLAGPDSTPDATPTTT